MGDERASSGIRKPLLFALKLVITVGLCVLIVRYVDWPRFWSVLRQSNLWIIGLVLVMRFGGLTISAVKWRLLLAGQDLRYGLGRLVRWYTAALFLTHFLPSSIGGDGYRIYKTWNNERGRACAVVAIFAERATGLLALVLLGYIAAIIVYARDAHVVARAVIIVVTIGFVVGGIGAWFLVRYKLVHRFAKWKLVPAKIGSMLTTLYERAGDFRRHPRENGLVALISFAFHLNKLLGVWLILYALGATTNFLELTVAMVTVEVIGRLPITLGGLGLVEGSFIYVMGRFGLGGETGLAAMLLMRVLLIPLSLVGAAFYFIGDREPVRPGAPGAE